MRVVYSLRRPRPKYFSIEQLVRYVCKAMPSDVECVVRTSPYLSRGVLPRILSLLDASWCPEEVNDIGEDERTVRSIVE